MSKPVSSQAGRSLATRLFASLESLESRLAAPRIRRRAPSRDQLALGAALIEPLEDRVMFDSIPPTVTLVSPPFATNPLGQVMNVTVRWADNVAIDPLSIYDQNLVILDISTFGASYQVYGTLTSKSQNPDGSWNATYAEPAPPVAGPYAIVSSIIFPVLDTSGNAVIRPINDLIDFQQLDTGGGGGTTVNPTASLTKAPIRSNGNASYDFDVTYTAQATIDSTTIDNMDVQVTGPGSYVQLATLQNTTAGTNTNSIVAHYRVPAPNVTGTYTIKMVANQVKDSAGTFVPAGVLGAFTGLPATFGQSGGGGIAHGGKKHAPPDLTVTFPGIIPAQGAIGGDDVIALRVSNLGDSATINKIQVELFASTNQVLGNSDSPLETITIPKLAGGQSKVIRVKFPYGDLPAGTYYLAAEIDPDQEVTESNETNNVGFSPTTITVAAPFVDLGAAVVGPLPATVLGGTPGKTTVRITNFGNTTFSREAEVLVYASADRVLDSTDTLLTDTTVGPITIKPGIRNYKDVKIPFTYPSNLANGDYVLIARVNGGPIINDTNTANDIGASDATFHLIQPSIDLTPTSVIVTNPGGAIALSSGTNRVDVLLRNLGNSDAVGPLTISISAAPVSNAAASVLLGSQTFDTVVKPNTLQRYTVTFTLPASVPTGSYTLKATVDSGNNFNETNESNNDVFSSIPVQIVQTI